MERLRNLGIYLNGEPGDAECLAFAGLLARSVVPEAVHCIHVRGLEDSTEAAQPAPEEIRGCLDECLPPEILDRIGVQVSHATGLREVLRTARDFDLDLIVVGRRLPADELGVGSLFYRLARKTPCDVLVVPERAHAHLNRLLVLVDGSEHAKRALRTALEIARAAGRTPQVIVQSVYHVGYGSHYTGMKLEEAGRQREALQRARIEAFLADVDTSGVDFQVVYTCSASIADAAHSLAAAKNMDAIVIGSRGATLPAIALLGPNAERVLVKASVPVLVVKRKGETFRFLDAVLAQFQEPG